jgi:hypothetical protein
MYFTPAIVTTAAIIPAIITTTATAIIPAIITATPLAAASVIIGPPCTAACRRCRLFSGLRAPAQMGGHVFGGKGLCAPALRSYLLFYMVVIF